MAMSGAMTSGRAAGRHPEREDQRIRVQHDEREAGGERQVQRRPRAGGEHGACRSAAAAADQPGHAVDERVDERADQHDQSDRRDADLDRVAVLDDVVC